MGWWGRISKWLVLRDFSGRLVKKRQGVWGSLPIKGIVPVERLVGTADLRADLLAPAVKCMRSPYTRTR